MKPELARQVLENFTNVTGIKARWRPLKKHEYMYDDLEGIVQFTIKGTIIEMPADVKSNVSSPVIPTFINEKNQNDTILILANSILPRYKKVLKDLGINYIDASGNAYINSGSVYVWIDGRKEPEGRKALSTGPFSKAGLKVIFLLLRQDDYINATFREIASVTGVSLDTVHKTINGLKKLGYLLALNDYTLQWGRKREVLDRWITEYESRLKQSLFIGNFSFITEKHFFQWKKMHFASANTRWGGEPAGELLTRNLKPERLTIYSDESQLDFIRNYKLKPDSTGYISIYKRFWMEDELRTHTVPPLLVYTDLVNTGNRRNIETAMKIYEQYLQDKF